MNVHKDPERPASQGQVGREGGLGEARISKLGPSHGHQGGILGRVGGLSLLCSSELVALMPRPEARVPTEALRPNTRSL